MILVKVFYNTEADNTPVPEDVPMDELPVSFFGPFDSMVEAVSWLENDYPDDEDVYDIIADDFDLEVEFGVGEEPVINDPKSLFGDIPDEHLVDDDDDQPTKFT